jgi:hypothetical protein
VSGTDSLSIVLKIKLVTRRRRCAGDELVTEGEGDLALLATPKDERIAAWEERLDQMPQTEFWRLLSPSLRNIAEI